MGTRAMDLRAYFVTGKPTRPWHAGGFEEVSSIARQAALGGAGVIQVRSKPIAARDAMALAEAVVRAVEGTGARVLVDDRVDVALALRRRGLPIAGVHLGQDDLPVQDARRLLGEDAIIGLTTGTLDLVRAAAPLAGYIDYIGAGPFRPTPTKNSGRPPLGLSGYSPLVEASPVPVVAIGDVRDSDAAALASTGVAGVAVVRGFMQAADPGAYAGRILAGFEQAGRTL